MGKSAKKTTTSDNNTKYTANTTGTQTGQQSVDVPDWLLNPAQRLAGSLGGLMGQGPEVYTPQMSGLTKQALTAAGGLDTTGAGYDAASAALGDLGSIRDVTGQSLLTNLSDYENPYRDKVLNPVLSDYDVNAGKTRAAQAAQAAAGGAFGGSRYGVREAQTEGELARGRAATEGGLLSDMFTQATGLSSQDAARRQQAMQGNQSADIAAQNNRLAAAQAMAQLANSRSADQRANIALQNQIGGQQTDFENVQRQYPIEYQQQMEGLLQGLNPQSYFGQSSTGTSTSNTTGTQDTHGKTVEKSNPGLLANLGNVMNLVKSGVGIFGAMSGNPALAALAGA